MYKLCKTEQSSRRQRQLEEELLRAMSVKRYEEITISDLCEQIGIPRKAFYRYFSGKDGALFALLDHRLMEYENRTDRPSEQWNSWQDLDWFFTFWKIQKPLLDAMARSGLSGILVERAIRSSQEALLFENLAGSREYVNEVTAFAVCGMMSMVLQWHQEGYDKSVEEMAQIARAVLSRPLIPGLEEKQPPSLWILCKK